MIPSDYRTATPVQPMSQELSEVFVMATIKDTTEPLPLTEEVAEKLGFPGQLIYKRLEVFSPQTKVSDGAVVVAIMQAGGHPGKLVRWAWTFHRMYLESGRMVTVSDLADAFPTGFPTDAAAQKLWDSQKGRPLGEDIDNLLDVRKTWEIPALNQS